jgi:hypothetical protein
MDTLIPQILATTIQQSMTTIVTLKELTEWILQQDDDRPVNMGEIRPSDPCGCVMVQYGKEKGFDFSIVTSFYWHNNNEIIAIIGNNRAIQSLVPIGIWDSKTFKPIKDYINSVNINYHENN